MEAWLPVATLACLAATAVYIYDGLGPGTASNLWLTALFGVGLSSLQAAWAVVYFAEKGVLKGSLLRLFVHRKPVFCVLALLFSPIVAFAVWAHSFAIAVGTSTATVVANDVPAEDDTIDTSVFRTRQLELAGPFVDVTKTHAAVTDAVRRAPHAARIDVFAAGEPAWLFWYSRKFFATAHAPQCRDVVEAQALLLVQLCVAVLIDSALQAVVRPATVSILVAGLAMFAAYTARACRGPHALSAVAAATVAFYAVLSAVVGIVAVVQELTGTYHLGTKRLLFGSATFGMSFPSLLYVVAWAVVWIPTTVSVVAVVLRALWASPRSLLVKVVFSTLGAPALLIFSVVYGCLARAFALYVAASSVCQGTFGRPHKPTGGPEDVFGEPMHHAGPWRLCSDFLRAAPCARSFRRRVEYLLRTWYAEEGGGAVLIDGGGLHDGDHDTVVAVFVREHLVGDFPPDGDDDKEATVAPWTLTRLAHRTIMRRDALLLPTLDQLLHAMSVLVAPVVLVCDGAFACVIAYDAAVERLDGGGGGGGDDRVHRPEAVLACLAACLLPFALLAIAVRMRHIKADVAAASFLCTHRITYANLVDLICRYHRVPVADAFGAAGAAALTGRQRLCPGVPPEVLEGAVAPFLEWSGSPTAAAGGASDAPPAQVSDGDDGDSDGVDSRTNAPDGAGDAAAASAAAILYSLTTTQLERLKDLRRSEDLPRAPR